MDRSLAKKILPSILRHNPSRTKYNGGCPSKLYESLTTSQIEFDDVLNEKASSSHILRLYPRKRRKYI
jgi:hypothetical protein